MNSYEFQLATGVLLGPGFRRLAGGPDGWLGDLTRRIAGGGMSDVEQVTRMGVDMDAGEARSMLLGRWLVFCDRELR